MKHVYACGLDTHRNGLRKPILYLLVQVGSMSTRAGDGSREPDLVADSLSDLFEGCPFAQAVNESVGRSFRFRKTDCV